MQSYYNNNPNYDYNTIVNNPGYKKQSYDTISRNSNHSSNPDMTTKRQ